MKSRKEYIKNIIIILVCLIISVVISHYFTYTDNKVIDYYVIINIIIALFSVSLTIVALMITILDKYKNSAKDQAEWATRSTIVLKSLSENTIFLLILIILLAILSIFEQLFALIPFINIMDILLLFSFILSLLITIDTTISVYILVKNLKDALIDVNNANISLNKSEENIIEAYRFLNPKYQKEMNDYLTTLALKQQINEKSK